MGNQTDYFERIGYRGKWSIGDRVNGKWNGIPFVGTVGNDRFINAERGPEVTVHLDLPILYEEEVYRIIIMRPKELSFFK